jgi:hypothetical protein
MSRTCRRKSPEWRLDGADLANTAYYPVDPTGGCLNSSIIRRISAFEVNIIDLGARFEPAAFRSKSECSACLSYTQLSENEPQHERGASNDSRVHRVGDNKVLQRLQKIHFNPNIPDETSLLLP